MKKIIFDFDIVETQEEIHEMIAGELEFPEYYGGNLDALYDCLTDIREETAIGFYWTEDDSDRSAYLRRVQQVFADAEEENDHLAVFFLTYYLDEYEEY